MAQYFCDSCRAEREDSVCGNCGRETRLLDESAPAVQAVPTPSPTPRKAFEVVDKRTYESPGEYAESRSAPPFETAGTATDARAEQTGAPAKNIVGLEGFHALLDRQMEAVIICGKAQSGKSEIAAGFTRANSVYRGKAQFNQLRATLRTDFSLGGTNPDEVWYQIIDEKRVFLDPSGEFFRHLSLDERRRAGLPDLTDDDFRFVERAAKQLAGLVLVVDLTHGPEDRDLIAWRKQENDFNFVLPAIRWLRWEKEVRPEALGVTTNIAQRANQLPMLDKPVLVLFSKADQLETYVHESPLHFAKRRLPILHGALMTHARRFRYDFCHTMVDTADGIQEVDHPCGVLTPMEWMLNDPFRWLPFKIPTRYLGGGK